MVNPSYVLGVSGSTGSQPGETSTRSDRQLPPGGGCRLSLTAATDIVDVRDVARGHMRAAEAGRPGERYILGGHAIGWVELIERVAELPGAGIRWPRRRSGAAGRAARRAEALRLPSSPCPRACC